MKRTLLSLAIAIPLLAGCASAGGMLNKAGNWLESSDNGIAKGVGGFYKGLGSAIAGTPTVPPEDEKEKKKE